MISTIEFEKIRKGIQSPQNAFYHKMRRLRSDLSNFKIDLEYINNGNKIVYVSDYTELKAYISPDIGLSDYLFDIHDLDQNQVEEKKIKRWYRLRELFFNEKRPTIILPPHLEELNKEIAYYMQRIVADQYKLLSVIKDFQHKIPDDKTFSKAFKLLIEIDGFKEWEKEKDLDLMNDFFDNYSLQLAALTYERKCNYNEGKSALQRITSLLNNGGIKEFYKYDWVAICGIKSCVNDEINKINIIDRYDELVQFVELFDIIRNKKILSNVVDAIAVMYMDEINCMLEKSGSDNIRIHLVTSALSVFKLTEAVSSKYLNAYVRHPKFLPALISDDKTYCIQMMDDIDKIIEAIDAYKDKCSFHNHTNSRTEAIEEILKNEISQAWKNIESKMFLKEVSYIKESEIGTVQSNSIKRIDYLVKTKDLLSYLHNHKAAFNLYIHFSYGMVFDNLVVFYINRLAAYGKYPALYLSSGKSHYPFRILWQSKAIRSIVELNDQILVTRICAIDSKEISIKSIIEAIINNNHEINEGYEINLIKAMCMLTAEQWHLAEILCRTAFKFEDIRPYEAYYLLSLIQRKLAFDKISEKKNNEALYIYSEAKISLSKAINIKRVKDYRFIFAHASMRLEEMYFPGTTRGVLDDISQSIEGCINELNRIKVEESGDYGEYLQFRCYQILMSFYFMWYIGFYGEYKSDPKKEAIVDEWYEIIKAYDRNKPQYKRFSITIDIIESACPLILHSDSMSRKQYIELFGAVYRGCKGLHTGGFYKMLVHDLKIELYKDMSNRFKLRPDEIEKWPELIGCKSRFP